MYNRPSYKHLKLILPNNKLNKIIIYYTHNTHKQPPTIITPTNP